MRKCFFALVLLCVSLLLLFSGCGGGGSSSPLENEPVVNDSNTGSAGDGSEVWQGIPQAHPAQFAPGTETTLESARIGENGGTLAGPSGTALEGWVVNVPPGALAETANISLAVNEGGFFAGLDQQRLVPCNV